MKFNIGDTVFYIESGIHYRKTIQCQMCFGKCKVTIIKGNGESIESECGACEKGLERATGFMTVWEPEAEVKSGTVSGISTKDGVKYEVGFRNLFQHELYDNKSIAEEVRKLKLEEVKEQSEVWFRDNFIQCTKKQLWSAHYHRSCIESAKRNISWHESRLCIIADKKLTTSEDE